MEIRKADYSVKILGELPLNPHDGNLDIEVLVVDNGRRFAATLFTQENIARIMNKYRETGECERGLYFWSSGMVIISSLTYENIERCVESLWEENELASAMQLLE